MSQQHHDISEQLKNFSISPDEDKITQQLNQTHLTRSTPSIFAIPNRVDKPDINNINHSNISNSNNASNIEDQWNSGAFPQPQQQQEEDGWGEGPPSYTSISQGTYFGFNSIIQSPAIASSVDSGHSNQQLPQAFSRFKNQPVSFTSALNNANKKQDN